MIQVIELPVQIRATNPEANNDSSVLCACVCCNADDRNCCYVTILIHRIVKENVLLLYTTLVSDYRNGWTQKSLSSRCFARCLLLTTIFSRFFVTAKVWPAYSGLVSKQLLDATLVYLRTFGNFMGQPWYFQTN